MQRPKGTKDIFGDESILREYLYDLFKKISKINNFKKIETPIFEKLETFTKTIGETTSIVSKEMYVFNDKKNRKMVLKPENTASVIRAIVENKLYNQKLPLKLFYITPNFRYERPQKGRQRQFTQFGVEVISKPNPYLDVEIILFAKTILDSLKISYKLLINSLGDQKTRDLYSKKLNEYFIKNKEQLTKNSKNRINVNPLRILDDKIDAQKEVVKNAPKIHEFYNQETKNYFFKLTNFLNQMDVKYEIEPKLVRGIDYYSDTCFEFVSTSNKAGAQSTLIGGGRYSNLIKYFGGPDLSGIGFGLGVERVLNEINQKEIILNNKDKLDVYLVNISQKNQILVTKIVFLLRKSGFSTEWNIKSTNLLKGLKNADSYKPKIKIIAGDNELANNEVIIKKNNFQQNVKIDNLVKLIKKEINHEKN